MCNFTGGFRSASGSQPNQCTSAMQLKLRERHRLGLWWVNMVSPSHTSIFLLWYIPKKGSRGMGVPCCVPNYAVELSLLLSLCFYWLASGQWSSITRLTAVCRKTSLQVLLVTGVG